MTETKTEGTRWKDVGDLGRLIDQKEALYLFQEAGLPVTRVTQTYLRWKQGENALVGFDLEGVDETGSALVLPAYVRTFEDDRATTVLGKWRKMGVHETPFGQGVRLLPGGQSVLALFPNDGRLRGLRGIADLAKVKHTLRSLPEVGEGWRIYGPKKSRLERVRYKPERRFIARALLAMKRVATGEKRKLPVFLRYFPDSRGERIAEITRSFEGSPIPIGPSPLGVLLDGRLYVEEFLEGEEILSSVLAGTVDGRDVARVLFALNKCDVPAGSIQTSASTLRLAELGLSQLSNASRRLEQEVGRILPRLRGQLPEERRVCPVHGDFHFHQVLKSKDGIRLVDFERVALADPYRDVGNLLAHARSLSRKFPEWEEPLERFATDFRIAYQELDQGSDGSLGFFTACGLIDQALLPFRRLVPDWEESSLKILQDCRTVLSPPAHMSRVDLSSRLDELDEPGFRWEQIIPRNKRSWPGRFRDQSGRVLYGIYDVEGFSFRKVEPQDDPLVASFHEGEVSGEIVAYRPECRVTLRHRREDLIVYSKVQQLKKTQFCLRRYRALQTMIRGREGNLPRFAPLLEVDESRGRMTFGSLSGRVLRDFLMCSSEPYDWREALSRTATAIAQLHSLCPSPDLTRLAHRAPEDWLGYAKTHFPKVASELCQAFSLLPPFPRDHGSDQLVTVHGDLHDGNILIEDEGVGLLDLDSLASGFSEEDVANFCSHLVLRGLWREELERGWAQSSFFAKQYRQEGGLLNHRRFYDHVLHALFRLAVVHIFRRPWQPYALPLLAEIRSLSNKDQGLL